MSTMSLHCPFHAKFAKISVTNIFQLILFLFCFVILRFSTGAMIEILLFLAVHSAPFPNNELFLSQILPFLTVCNIASFISFSNYYLIPIFFQLLSHPYLFPTVCTKTLFLSFSNSAHLIPIFFYLCTLLPNPYPFPAVHIPVSYLTFSAVYTTTSSLSFSRSAHPCIILIFYNSAHNSPFLSFSISAINKHD